MATPIGSLYASLTMDVGQYASGWALADKITARGASNIRKEAGLAQASVARFAKTSASSGIKPYGLIAVSRAFERVNDRVGLLRGTMLATTAVFGGLTAALSSNLVLRYADTYNNLTNQIRVVSDDAADLAGQLAAVQAAADNSRSSLQSTAVLYSRLAKAAPTKSNSDVLDYVQTIQKALALGGATAQEAASAAIQFSQAIASNRLGGEELRAVLETPLGLALAKGLDVTIGKLRQMSIAGELTADRVLGALEKIKGGIDQQFSKSILTIDQSLIKADNQLTAYIGTLDKTYGLTRIVSGGILGFANNIDKVAGSAVALGLALGSAFAGRLAGRGIGKAVDSTFGEVSRRAADARDQVQKLTKAQHDLAQELDRGTRALGSLKGRDNIEFASKSDVKILQREEAKLNKIREDRLATTTRLRDAVSAANAVEVKSSKSTIASANKIVETQSKIEDSLARQTTLTNELQKAETRLTAAKGQQTLNVANIGAVKEAEKDITKIRQAQIAETTKAAQLEDAVGTQRIALAAKIGDAEAKAAEQKAKFQAIAQTASKQTAKLLTEEFDQTQRLGRARAAIGEVGGIGKAAEVRGAEAALGGLRQGLEDTSQSLASAVRGTSVLRQSFGLLKTGAASLVGFLGGPWGVAFTGAIALTTLLGIRSAEAAQQAENTKKALKDVLGDIANAGGGQGQIAQDSLHTDELKGQLDEKKNQIDLFTAGLKTQAGTIENVLIRIFDPTLNPALAGNSKFADLFGSATAGINNLIKRVGVGEVQLSGINRELRALPEAKFIDDDQISKLTVAVSEAAKLQLALNRVNNQASQLKTTLSSGVGSINVEAEINRAGQQSADALELYEASLKASRKTAQGLLFDLQNINDETSLESDIRKGTAAIMKDNKDLLEGEAREIAIVNTVLDLINSKSEAWWRSSEATKGEVAQILAMAKQIAPEMKFDKPDATTSQLAAIDDMINGQVQANKKILERRGLIGQEQSLLETEDGILESIAGKNIKITDAIRQRVRVGAQAIIASKKELDILEGVSTALQNAASGDLIQAKSTARAKELDELIQRQTDLEALTERLKLAQTDLGTAFANGGRSMFGQAIEIDGVSQSYGAIDAELQNLVKRFIEGSVNSDAFTSGLAKIRKQLSSLGANSTALDGFIKGIQDAVSWIARLTGALDTLKANPVISKAGLTGTRTVDPATGIGVSRFRNTAAAADEEDATRYAQHYLVAGAQIRADATKTSEALNLVGAAATDSAAHGIDAINTLSGSALSSINQVFGIAAAIDSLHDKTVTVTIKTLHADGGVAAPLAQSSQLKDAIKAVGDVFESSPLFNENYQVPQSEINARKAAIAASGATDFAGRIAAGGRQSTNIEDDRVTYGAVRSLTSGDDSKKIVKAIESGVSVTRVSQDLTTAAANAVGDCVRNLDQTASGGFRDLSNQQHITISKLSEVTAAMNLNSYALAALVHNNDSGATGTGNTMFGDAFDSQYGSYISSWGIGKIKRPTLQTGPQDYGKQPQSMGNITVGDINVNGVTDGAEAGRQAAYEFIRTVDGALSGRV